MIGTDRIFWVALTQFRLFGAVRIGKLANYFQSMERAFNACASELMEAGIEAEIASRFLQERIHIDPESVMRELETRAIQPITIKDEIYPPLLKEIYDPPAVLFVRGALPNPARKTLAVVGSRKPSNYGTKVTKEFIESLAREGIVIVSGLAHGIDAVAHDAALRSGGTTIAILGSGVDQESIYPSGNRALASQILTQGGAIISEFPIGTPPLKQHFPFRNRIIAGMCHGTLVVEAAIKSGSLITARSALESGREVYAVPGSIHSPLSEGPNNLIKMGATPVCCAEDLLGRKIIDTKSAPEFTPSTDEETALWRILCNTPLHIDEIVRGSGLRTDKALSTLTLMEMKGATRHEGGNYYTRIK
jgi:DNA processing protein